MSAPSSRHIPMIAMATVRYALRGGSGVVFVWLSIALGLMVCALVFGIVEQIANQSDGGASFSTPEGRKEFLAASVEFIREPLEDWIVGDFEDVKEDEKDTDEAIEEFRRRRDASRKWIDFLIKDNPALLVAMYGLLIYLLPFFVNVGSFNQLSGDMQHRALRFMLLRVSRANLLWGRFLGTSVFVILVLIALLLTVLLYVGGLQLYESADLWRFSVRGMLAVVFLVPPYVAICLGISSRVDSPFGSLLLGYLVLLFLPAVALAGYRAWEPAGKLIWVLPYRLHEGFFHPDLDQVVIACLGCVGYTSLYLLFAFRGFIRRDL